MKMTEILKPKTEKEIWDGINCLCENVTLIASARNGFMPGVIKALERGADINFYDEFDGCSVLAAASENGHFEIVRYLLDRKALVCNVALMGVFDIPDLFTEMLKEADLEYCCGLELALKFAEEQERTEIVDLIRERIKRG